MSKDKIGDRMKYNYENRTKQFLTRRVPTIIRLDGKAFHTYTKGLNKPFDDGLIADMQETTKFLCDNVQGCKLGYTQSDEITLVLTDYDNLQTDAWFDYNVQKMTSVSASIATAKFNQLRLQRHFNKSQKEVDVINKSNFFDYDSVRVDNVGAQQKLAFFDSRVFQIGEKEEVVNSLIWRQQDAERNSIQMLAQSLYSQKQLHGKNTSVLQDMCWQKGQNWNDLDSSKKRGSLILKQIYVDDKKITKENASELGSKSNLQTKIRTKWEVIDTPIFTKDRGAILNLI
jgi:tRNA(His) 5'-end guanylyltransferase